jgi:integrase
MPARPEGVYPDKRGQWYFKVTIGRDPLTGRRDQITRRGFRTAAEAAAARREVAAKASAGLIKPSRASLTVNELLDQYLDGIDADRKLSAKTCHDYRVFADVYIRPHLGTQRVRDVTPDVIVAWQRKMLKEGGHRRKRALSANTIRLARAPLAGAFKLAVSSGLVAVNPLSAASRPTPPRSVPKGWTPEQARKFLSLMEGDRTYPIWAFLMGSGLRIGELVALRWPNVDLEGGVVRVVEFTTYVGHELAPSSGKSPDAVRGVDIDEALAGVLRLQGEVQGRDRAATDAYEESEFVFTKPGGGPYHPQYLSKLLGTYSSELGLPRLTAHGLRHTCATLMLANGVPPKVAAERLGHSDPTLFMNLYSHVTPSMQKEAAAKIGAALFG